MRAYKEGTWALKGGKIPSFKKDIEALKHKYYSYVGDDQLYDCLDNAISRLNKLQQSYDKKKQQEEQVKMGQGHFFTEEELLQAYYRSLKEGTGDFMWGAFPKNSREMKERLKPAKIAFGRDEICDWISSSEGGFQKYMPHMCSGDGHWIG